MSEAVNSGEANDKINELLQETEARLQEAERLLEEHHKEEAQKKKAEQLKESLDHKHEDDVKNAERFFQNFDHQLLHLAEINVHMIMSHVEEPKERAKELLKEREMEEAYEQEIQALEHRLKELRERAEAVQDHHALSFRLTPGGHGVGLDG